MSLEGKLERNTPAFFCLGLKGVQPLREPLLPSLVCAHVTLLVCVRLRHVAAAAYLQKKVAELQATEPDVAAIWNELESLYSRKCVHLPARLTARLSARLSARISILPRLRARVHMCTDSARLVRTKGQRAWVCVHENSAVHRF